MKTFLRGILFEENRTGWHYVFGSIAFLVLAAFFFWDEYPVVGMIASVAAIIGAPIDYLRFRNARNMHSTKGPK